MDQIAPDDVTRLLEAAAAGDREAGDRVHRAIEHELRAIARRQLRDQRVGHTLQTTALMNEAWIRLLGTDRRPDTDRPGFLRLAATTMRTVLIDHARRRGAIKRGGDRRRVSLEAADPAVEDGCAALIAVDEALRQLERLDERKASIVEMRFFGGLEVAEIARQLEISAPTVKREWRAARAWLQRALGEEDHDASPSGSSAATAAGGERGVDGRARGPAR